MAERPYKTINVENELHRRLKLIATLDGVSLTELTDRLLREYLDGRKRDVKRVSRSNGGRA